MKSGCPPARSRTKATRVGRRVVDAESLLDQPLGVVFLQVAEIDGRVSRHLLQRVSETGAGRRR